MEQYILKSAVVAEIERLKGIQLSIFSKGETKENCSDSLTCISVYNEILSFLDTIEVKDVNLEKEMNDYFVSMELQEHENIFESTFRQIARHFFELGNRTNCGNNSYEYFNIGYLQAIEDACKWLQENCIYTHPRKGSKECIVNIPRFKNDLLK